MKFNKKYYESYLKYIFVLLFFPGFVSADEFDWDHSSTSVSEVELSTESGTISVVVGSHCAGGSDYCDIAAKFSSAKKRGIEFLRETANGKATISVAENRIVISLIYYPMGWEKGLEVNKYYEWNKSSETLELKESIRQDIEI